MSLPLTTLESVAEEVDNLDIHDDDADKDQFPESDLKILKSLFRLFAKFGDTAADGKTIKVFSTIFSLLMFYVQKFKKLRMVKHKHFV